MLHISDINNTRYFSEPESERMRMIGLNVSTSFCSDNQPDSIFHSKHRNQYLKLFIESENVSFASFCEVSPSQAQFLLETFPNFNIVGYFSETSNDLITTLNLIQNDPAHSKCVGEGICVMIDKKYKIVDQRAIILPKGTRHSRILVSVTIQLSHSRFTIMSTHLDHLSRESRVQSLKQIGDYVSQLNHPFFIYGDFNLFPDVNGEEDYLNFLQMNKTVLTDATSKNHYGSWGTFCSFKDNKFAPLISLDEDIQRYVIKQSNRLDLLFVSPQINVHFTHCPLRSFDPQSGKLLIPTDKDFDENFKKRHFFSDHWPIVCQFDFLLSKM